MCSDDPLVFATRMPHLASPIDWANESIAVGRDVVYTGIPADGDPPKLDRLYVENGVVVVRDRLAKAGVRLAAVLNRVAK